ncbi:MAG: DUF2069 domain-containing protein [Nevskiaceae bacterium]|nr:MAG: DUF2069 domain-containing protein [Nevskiaceae bacterium]TBR73966.1 MAG: DUF2069 domain-containing protein [Nevskiaceae bacterium]
MSRARPRPSTLAWGLALAAQAVLAAGLMAWSGWVAGAILSAPMLLTLPGLLRRRPRSAAWAGYLMVLYFAGLMAEAYALHERHTDGVLLAAAALIAFFSLILFVRWSARERPSGGPARHG